MTDIRSAIIEATVDAYIDDPTHLTVEAVCARAGTESAVFHSHFTGVNDVIRAWYPYAVDLVSRQSAEIAEFDALPLQERLGTFCFMLLDMLESRLPFVQATFTHQASGFTSRFHRRLRDVLQDVLYAPDVPGVNLVVVDTDATRFVLAEAIVQLVQTWLKDDSQDRARATALIDRVLSLLSEVLTNRVPQKGVDLARYAVEAGYLPLDRLPIIGEHFRREDDDE